MSKKLNISPLLVVAGLVVLAVTLALAAPARAITWGEPDVDNVYSNVGSIVVDPVSQEPSQFCSGTLIAPSTFLTAGHCTDYLEELISSSLLSLETIQVSFSAVNIFDTGTWWDVAQIITHPEYDDLNANNPHDVGLIILSEVVDLPLANLPEEGFMDELKQEGVLHEHQDKALITVVGYGMTVEWPHPQAVDNGPGRWYANSQYQALTKPWLHLSQNHNLGLGGSCYGDSGGPAFIDYEGVRWLVGVSSWGDGMCLANGFDYRVDTADMLGFIAPYLEP